MKKLTVTKYSTVFLFCVMLLFSFSGVWHPFLHCCHGAEESRESRKLVPPSISFAAEHCECLLCSGFLFQEIPPESVGAARMYHFPHAAPCGTDFYPYRIARMYAARAPPSAGFFLCPGAVSAS